MPESALAPASPAERRVGTPATAKPDKTALGSHRPFTANVARDPIRGLSPHDDPAKEPRGIESPALPAVRRSPDRPPASSGSTCPGDRLRTWPSPTARPATCPCRPRRPMTAAPPPESAMSCETNSDLLQPAPTPGEARCGFFCLKVICVLVFFVRPTLKMSRALQRHDRTDGQARRLHFAVGRLGRASDSPTSTPENDPTLEQPVERRAVTPATVEPDTRHGDLTSRSPRTCRVTPFVD